MRKNRECMSNAKIFILTLVTYLIQSMLLLLGFMSLKPLPAKEAVKVLAVVFALAF
mgnify:CR=1 FL=1